MRKIIGLLAAFLLLAASASASVLVANFNVGEIIIEGIIHHHLYISGSTGAPEVGKAYYFTADDISTNEDNAVAVSEVKEEGALLYSSISETPVGGCTWMAAINDGDYKVAIELDGTSVSIGDEIRWSVTPDSSTVTQCRKEFDLNVVYSE